LVFGFCFYTPISLILLVSVMGLLKLLRELVFERVGSERAFTLLPSLETSRITRVKWVGRYSRSGSTYFVKKLDIELETGKHTHKLSCWSSGGVWFCDWYADNEHMGVVEIRSYEKPVKDALNIIKFALTSETIDNEVELKKKPEVVPEISWELLPKVE